jgi:aminoglycoside phosphotransferase (APT) family kinase protein
VLSAEALAAGEKVIGSFQWVQDQISLPPRTFLHGDVKAANMFMLTNSDDTRAPAFFDWQYIAIGKGGF